MERRIILTKEQRYRVRKLFGVTEKMMSEALCYRSDSALAQKIRVAALEHGGMVAGTPEMQTTHDGERMIQTWGDKARLVVNKATSEVQVYVDGVLERTYPQMTVTELMREQRRLRILAASRP